MDIVSDNYNQPAGVDIRVKPLPAPIQHTGPVIQAWTPIVHQHKAPLNIPTVTSHISAPVLDVYISVNPNMNKYTNKYNDQTFETTTINNDFTINEYINQQNKNIWDAENDITHKNIDNRQIKPGPVQFLKGSNEPHKHSHKPSESLLKLHSYFYRGYINPSRSNHLHRPNGGQHQSHNYSIQQTQKSGEQLQPNNYSMQQIQTSYHDEVRKDYQKNTWRGQDTNNKIRYNSTDVARYKSNELEQDSKKNYLGNSFLSDITDLNDQQYTQNRTQYNKYNPLNTKFRDVRPEEIKSDEVSPNRSNLLYRPNLKNNFTRPKEQTPSHEQKLTIKHAQDINDQPEIYPDLKIKKKIIKLNKKKLNTLEKVFTEQKNLDDLVEQRDDLSQEIWEQNFINLGKERNIGQGQEKKSNSKEQSEEISSIWDQNMNQEKGFQWHNHIEHLNMSMQKLKYHKQAVEDFIYANTGSIPLYDNKGKKHTKNFSRITNKKKVGDTRDIELAYLKEIEGTTKPPPPPPVEQKRPERVHSPLWNAMESYYTFAKDIIVSWFD